MDKRLAVILLLSLAAWAGESPAYKVLPGISHGRLTIFPVVTADYHDTSRFLTLDEGLRSGKVVVTEAGKVQGLQRGRARSRPAQDEVSRLLLINNSDRPLLLLAGEIVTGGNQDRVVAKDRIVPPRGEPVDLSVFCVEPDRWSEKTASFSGLAGQMAPPTVRNEAMAAKSQAKVWEAVKESNDAVTVHAEAVEVRATTSSLAVVADNEKVKRKLSEMSDPIERAYRRVIRDLADRKAVGVVVAVNGRVIWADIFASPQLLQTYWPKLIRSYVSEVIGQPGKGTPADEKDAQAFLGQLQGKQETIETEAAVFRHAEITGNGFRVFTLTSLLPKTGYDVHIAKMADETKVSANQPRPTRR